MIIKALTNLGHSKGIIIPKVLLQIMGSPEKFILETEDKKIILTPINEKKTKKKGA